MRKARLLVGYGPFTSCSWRMQLKHEMQFQAVLFENAGARAENLAAAEDRRHHWLELFLRE